MAFVEQEGLSKCTGPCADITPHRTIRPVSRGRLYLLCRVCGSVSSIPKPPEAP